MCGSTSEKVLTNKREKRLVISMACGNISRRYSEITFPLIQKYAQKCGADFHAYYQEQEAGFAAMKQDFNKFAFIYDKILYIDADMVVLPHTPNLFEQTPSGHFAAVNEHTFQDLTTEGPPIDRYEDMLKLGKITPRFYFNVGMYLFDIFSINIFTNDPSKFKECYFKEQSYINYKLHENSTVNTIDLGYKFNFMHLMYKQSLNKDDAYIIHYAGSWGGHSPDNVIRLMKEDIKKYEERNSITSP